MNSPVIRYVLGHVMAIEGILMILPIVVGVIYNEKVASVYAMIALLVFLIGRFLSRKRPESFVFYFKDGCVATALSWIVLSVIGCLPFYVTGEIPHFIDALFETVSGFTTTGASILNDVEALSRTATMWRSFTHWIGGMGVLVFLLAIIPMKGGYHMNLMKAESPGPSVGKFVPKVRDTAKILYIIYLGLTVMEFLFLIVGKMPVFDALNTSFATAGTGGFGIKGDSLASYSAYHQWIVTIFMILFGVNFSAYYLILFGKLRKALSLEEVKAYLMVIVVAVTIITVDIVRITDTVQDAIRHASFTVASIITTTGFATLDFNLWSETSKMILVMLMFVGACAGSTGGGIKVSRFIILLKTVKKELGSYIHPKSVKKIQMDEHPLDPEIVRSTNVYFITFIIVFSISCFLLSFEHIDLVSTFTAVAACINNIGPGIELVGPTANYGFLSDGSKLVLVFDMLAGRLELFPILVLLTPEIWRDLFTQKVRKIKH